MGHEGRSWLDRCRLYRDRLIASPRVQRWALANPVTRPVAQRRARAMLDLCAGFVYSQVLFTCVRLHLFDILFKEPLTTAALAERLSLSPEATCRLLDAAVSLGLAERRGRSVYGLGQLGAALAGSRAALSPDRTSASAVRRSPGSGGAASGFPSRYGYCSLLALLGGRASNGAGGGGGRVLQRAHDRVAASHCAGSARTPIRSTGIAAFSTWAVAKEFSSPRRQRGRRPYASCFSICAEAMSGVRGAEPLDAYYGFYTLPWAEASQEPRRRLADCCGTQASAASVFCATACPS